MKQAVSRANAKTLDWTDAGDGQSVYTSEGMAQLEVGSLDSFAVPGHDSLASIGWALRQPQTYQVMGELYAVATRWDTVLLYVGRQIQSERLLVDAQYEVHVHNLLKIPTKVLTIFSSRILRAYHLPGKEYII